MSYVEFQKNYRALLVYHKAALVSSRDFWRLLMSEKVNLVGGRRRHRLARLGSCIWCPALHPHQPACSTHQQSLSLICNHPLTMWCVPGALQVSLSRAFVKIDAMEQLATNTYSLVLERQARGSAFVTRAAIAC